MIEDKYFETINELKQAVKDGKVIEYDFSNGFKNHYVVVDFSLPLLTDDVDMYSNDFDSEKYNCIGYESPLENYRLKSQEDIERDEKKSHNKKIDSTILKLLNVKNLIDEIESESTVVSRYFNNKSFAFRYEIIDNEIERLKQSKFRI